MTKADLLQLAERGPQLTPHIEKLVSKADQEQRAWQAGWNQVKNGDWQ